MIVTPNKVRVVCLFVVLAITLGSLWAWGRAEGTIEECAASCPSGMQSFARGSCQCFAPGFSVKPIAPGWQSLSIGGQSLRVGSGGNPEWFIMHGSADGSDRRFDESLLDDLVSDPAARSPLTTKAPGFWLGSDGNSWAF